MICYSDIVNLKTDIFDKVGQKIIIKGSLGRNKSFEKEATIEKAYPNIFTVKYDEGATRNATYSYTDVLTRTVEVDVLDGDSYCPLIPPPTEDVKKKMRLQNKKEHNLYYVLLAYIKNNIAKKYTKNIEQKYKNTTKYIMIIYYFIF